MRSSDSGRGSRADLAGIEARRAEADERRTAAALARRSAQDRLASVLASRESVEAEFPTPPAAGRPALAALSRLQGAGERSVRGESAAMVAGRLRGDLAEALRARESRSDEAVQALEAAASAASAAARDAAGVRGQAAERARHAQRCSRRRSVPRRIAPRSGSMPSGGSAEGVDTGLEGLAGVHGAAHRALVGLGTARERGRGRHERSVELLRQLRERHEAARAHARTGAPDPAQLERRPTTRVEARAAAGAGRSRRARPHGP